MTTPQTESAAPKSLLSRIFGVLFAPRATYADVAARPRVLGVMVVVVGLIAATTFGFLSTKVGQQASLDQQISMMESFGINLPDQAITQMEDRASMSRYYALPGILIFVPIVQMIMAGLALVIFNAILGGEATFKQVLAIVAHSGVIGVIQQLLVTPLNYVRESMTSATSLAVFLPMVDEMSLIGRIAGGLDFFRIWSMFSLAIGLAVLYKRRTAPIAWALFLVYFIIVLVIAGVQAALSGA
jgi:Yip1 domain